MRLPLSILDYSRSVAGEPDIKLQNRYFEQDPTNTDRDSSGNPTPVALISRPAMRKWLTMATAPSGRCVYSQPGTFEQALFNVAGDTVYKIDQDETVSSIGTLDTSTGAVSMSATEVYLFIADGSALHYYTENDFARGVLTTTGVISANETVVIGAFTYKFVTDVTPAADGSSGSPWLILLDGTTTDNLARLLNAINNTGEAGVDYSVAMLGNTDVHASFSDATTLKVRAVMAGTDANSVATTETMANASWGGAVLAGGGATAFDTIDVPDGIGIVSVATIIGFTICVIAPTFQENGRYYFLRPGEIEIDPLDFETAERSPDPAWNAVPIGDHFWLPGWDSTEDQYPTGDGDAPFQRQEGHLFDKGVWQGTVVPIKDDVMCVGTDGTVYRIGAEPVVVSNPGISQRISDHINNLRAQSTPTPRVSLDFKNGSHSVGGISKTIDQVLEQNATYGTYSNTDVVDGVGLQATGTALTVTEPVLTAGAFAKACPDVDTGFTAVMTFSLATPGAQAQVGIDLAVPDTSEGWGFTGSWTGSSTSNLYDYGGTINDAVTISGVGEHKVAVTLSADHLAASIDGGSAVVTAAPTANAATIIGLYCIAHATGATVTAIIEKIEFFPPHADADLPGLSS
jgi:hypothetical protein